MKLLVLLSVLFLVQQTTAQVWDTTKNLSRHEAGYAKFKPSIKATIGYNGYMNMEIARVRNSLSLVWLMSNTATKYYALQWVANNNYKAGLWGAKFGAEVDFRFLHLGFEVLAQTDFQKLRWYTIPTLGLTWWGKLGIYYGFVGLIGKKDFIGNNSYQLALKYNFTKNLFKEFKDGTDF
jgi:hypothetical protein